MFVHRLNMLHALRECALSTQSPFNLKNIISIISSTFGDKFPQNGFKNVPKSPKVTRGITVAGIVVDRGRIRDTFVHKKQRLPRTLQ